MLDNLSQFGNNQQEPSFKQRVFGGIASGLKDVLEENILRSRKNKEIEYLNNLGLKPEVSNVLYNLSQQDTKLFVDALKNLSPDAYVEGKSPLFGGAKPLISQTFEDKEMAAERAEQRKIRDEYLKKQTTKLDALEDVSKDAKMALEHLEKHEDEMPWLITRLLGRKPEASQNPAQRRQEALYRRIATKAAIKNLVASGSRAGKSFLDVAEKEKAMLNQPIETQKELLKDIIREYEESLQEKSALDEIKEANQGKYPLNLIDKLREKKSSKMVKPVEKDGKLFAVNPATGKLQEIRKKGV